MKKDSFLTDVFGNDSLAAALAEAFPGKEKLTVNHHSDGELDDLHASRLLYNTEAVALINVKMDSGNSDIYYSPKNPSDAERREQKLTLATTFVGDTKLIPGAVSGPKTADKNKFTQKELADVFATDSQVLLSTTSMELLIKAVRARAVGDEAKNCLANKFVFFYDSVNLHWAIEALVKEKIGAEEFKKLEQDKTKKREATQKELKEVFDLFSLTGLNHIHTDGFTLMGDSNKVNSRTTPNYLDLMNQFDTANGKEAARLPDTLNGLVRPRQARKVAQIIAGLIHGSYAQIIPEKLSEAKSSVTEILKAVGITQDEEKTDPVIFFRNLAVKLDIPLAPKIHAIVSKHLKTLHPLISKEASFPAIDTSKEVILGSEAARPFNIYSSCAEQGSALISDQIPSVMICEAAQLRQGETPVAGIIHLIRQGEFDGFNDQGYPKYKPTRFATDGRGKCFYIDRAGYLELAKARGVVADDKTLVARISKGLDETFVRTELSNSSKPFITPEGQEKYLKTHPDFRAQTPGSILLASVDSLTVTSGESAAPKPSIKKDNVSEVHKLEI